MTPDMTSQIWLIVKFFFIIAMLLYAGFSAIIVRQEQLMSDVMEENFESVLKLLTFVHLAAAVGLIFLAVLLL
jgi:hypothetical protein